MSKILITGGAGFIGNAIIEKLYRNYDIVVLDNFSPQIHGENYTQSFLYKNLINKCFIIVGNVCNALDLKKALAGVDYIIHLAAETGTGQSMYEINRYTNVNIYGTSNLLEIILKDKLPVKKIILSSSRSVYGEGMYRCMVHGSVVPYSRKIEDMKKGDFEVKCPCCGGKVELLRTIEDSALSPISYYAYTKLAQEKMLEVMCPTMNIPYTIFRYQNVFGPGQSLSNPYTGILSIFSKQLLSNQSVNIFEDGLESRDFIFIDDVASITCDALNNPDTNNQHINVGYGERLSVYEIAQKLKKIYQSTSKITISGDFRKGDIRHNIADITKAKAICNFNPAVGFDKGLKCFSDWVQKQYKETAAGESAKLLKHSFEEMDASGIMIRGRI